MSFAGNFPTSNRLWNRCTEDQRGWALISVLWTVTLLALLAAGLQELSLASWRLEGRVRHAAIAEAALDASVARAVAGIADPQVELRWRVDGVARNFTFDGTAIQVSVQDGQGLINLNAADESLIRQLLKTTGLSDDDAASLTDKILDWRSKIELHRLHGATDADYRARFYPYHQRHDAFQTVDELRLVMGMTPALFSQIAPALTVDGNSSALNASTAPREVMLALNNNDGKLVDSLLTRRLLVRMMPDDLPTKIPAGIVDPTSPLGGRIFTITSKATLDGHAYTRRAEVEFADDAGRAYFLLDWR